MSVYKFSLFSHFTVTRSNIRTSADQRYTPDQYRHIPVYGIT